MDTKSVQQANMTICKKHNVPMERVKYDYAFATKFSLPLCEINVCPICDKENEKIRDDKEKKRNEEILNSGIPKLFLGARLEDFSNISIITSWCEKPEDFLFIHGVCGCGKSRLACAIKYYFNSKSDLSKLEFSSNLFLELRNSFNKSTESNEADVISKYTGNCIVIFDDIGAQKMSEYAIESWYNIIDKRYMNRIPTVFTSNLSLKEISEKMSDRIASRLASGTVFELKGKDRRIQSKKQMS